MDEALRAARLAWKHEPSAATHAAYLAAWERAGSPRLGLDRDPRWSPLMGDVVFVPGEHGDARRSATWEVTHTKTKAGNANPRKVQVRFWCEFEVRAGNVTSMSLSEWRRRVRRGRVLAIGDGRPCLVQLFAPGLGGLLTVYDPAKPRPPAPPVNDPDEEGDYGPTGDTEMDRLLQALEEPNNPPYLTRPERVVVESEVVCRYRSPQPCERWGRLAMSGGEVIRWTSDWVMQGPQAALCPDHGHDAAGIRKCRTAGCPTLVYRTRYCVECGSRAVSG